MPNLIDLTGQRFERLAVLGRAKGEFPQKGAYWICLCDCGTVKPVSASALRRGDTRSCGCLAREVASLATKKRNSCYRHPKHGIKSEGKLYRTWIHILQRCENPCNKAYPRYGGRGIKVCPRWKGSDGLSNFIKDMGEPPSLSHSIDRIDVNGDYEASNCRRIAAGWKDEDVLKNELKVVRHNKT